MSTRLSIGAAFLLGTSTIAATAMIPSLAHAQVTTSAIRGEVLNPTGTPVANATAVVTHVPSGTRSTAITNDNGVFSARNLRVGGPYTVTVSGDGFDTVERGNIFIALDTTVPVTIIAGGVGDQSARTKSKHDTPGLEGLHHRHVVQPNNGSNMCCAGWSVCRCVIN